MYRKPPTMLRRTLVSFFLGFGIFLLGVTLRTLLDMLGVSGMKAAIDDVLTGIVAGLLIFAYERHQHKLILEKMRMIAEMNHHVRNALQPILYSSFLNDQSEQVRLIQEGTRRIEWALREVLPGEDAIPPGSKSSTSQPKSAA
jgi:hypothetical protein